MLTVCGPAAEKADGDDENVETDPEDEEHEMMNMPLLRSVMNGTELCFLPVVVVDLVIVVVVNFVKGKVI